MIYKGVRFTKHAIEKLRILEKYGLKISLNTVINIVENPTRIDRRGKQYLAIKPLNESHALRVVYEIRKGIKTVITLYPVRRKRYGI